MIKFEFKLINQETTPRYHPPTPAAGGSARTGSNADATVCFCQLQTIVPSLPSTSPPPAWAIAPAIRTSLMSADSIS
jgi:hypothetical protein